MLNVLTASMAKVESTMLCPEWWRVLKSLREVAPDYLRFAHECIAWGFAMQEVDTAQDRKESQIPFFGGVGRRIGELERGEIVATCGLASRCI